MKLKHVGLSLAALSLCALGAIALQEPQMPKPGPEHALLMKGVGTWDATVTMYDPTKPAPTTSKATEVRKAVGEFWVASDFTGEIEGSPFVGHGLNGYDPDKKKYVGVWVDSMMSHLLISEGTYDEASRTMTMKANSKQWGTGKPIIETHKLIHKDADNCTFEMWHPGDGGKDVKVMSIDYKRRK